MPEMKSYRCVCRSSHSAKGFREFKNISRVASTVFFFFFIFPFRRLELELNYVEISYPEIVFGLRKKFQGAEPNAYLMSSPNVYRNLANFGKHCQLLRAKLLKRREQRERGRERERESESKVK